MKRRLVMVMRLSVAFAALVLVAGTSVYRLSEAANFNTALVLAQADKKPRPVEKPVAREINPPGDIPDSQVFVKYASSKGGYELQVPEGWARKAVGADVVFTSRLDGLSVTVSKAQGPPEATGIRAGQAKNLKKTGRAVIIRRIEDVRVGRKPAVLLAYECNSEPNPVTDKQVRLENETYFFYKDGKRAALRLWAPLGADNADQWKLISHSFRWR
jgi:hypothetical protein